MIEAICRQYITGSMWRSYTKGERDFCGIELSEGLEKDSKLAELLQTPSTKGILEGIPGVPAVDDVNITRKNIEDNFEAFNFKSLEDITLYEKLLKKVNNFLFHIERGVKTNKKKHETFTCSPHTSLTHITGQSHTHYTHNTHTTP